MRLLRIITQETGLQILMRSNLHRKPLETVIGRKAIYK